MTTKFKALSALRGDRQGNIATMTALLAPVLIGFGGLASDTAQWALMKRAMQRQADSSAIAGALAVARGGNAEDAVLSEMPMNNNYEITNWMVENAPTSGPYAGNQSAVWVRMEAQSRLPFSGMFLSEPMTISVEAVAADTSEGQFCALALSQTGSGSINFPNAAAVYNSNCGIHANSTNSTAITANSNANVNVSLVSAAGGISNIPSSTNRQVQPFRSTIADPFASIGDPSPTGMPRLYLTGSANLQPGIYNDITINGNNTVVNFAPGTYYIRGGQLRFNGGTANGSGVTFVLMSALGRPASEVATVSIGSNSRVNLSAPNSGTYKGIVFFQDRRAASSTWTLRGGPEFNLQGALYAPKSFVSFSGNGNTLSCFQLVSNTMEFTGNSTVENNCPVGSGSVSIGGSTVRLVG